MALRDRVFALVAEPVHERTGVALVSDASATMRVEVDDAAARATEIIERALAVCDAALFDEALAGVRASSLSPVTPPGAGLFVWLDTQPRGASSPRSRQSPSDWSTPVSIGTTASASLELFH